MKRNARAPRLPVAGALALLLALAAACAPAAPRGPAAAGAAGAASGGGSDASGPGARPSGTGPGRFTVVLVSPLTNHNPYSQSGGDITIAWQSIFQGLVRATSERTYEPLVAERWETPDPTTWRFHLRPGVRFSDGSPLTAADVKHSLERALNDPDSTRRSSISTVESAAVVDDLTVDVTTKVPNATLLGQISTIPITSKALYDRVGKEAADRQPVSAGPYVLQELVPDQRMVMRKNPYYWHELPDAPDEVMIRWIKEPMVALTALLSGEVDMTAPLPPNLTPQLTGSVRAMQAPSGFLYFLGLGAVGPLTSKPVRQAINYAIDKDAIISGILKGNAQRADVPLINTSIGYAPDVTPRYSYDPARARQLLAQAGYPDGFPMEIYHPVGRFTNDVDIASAIAAQLGQVGIQVTLKPTETSTFLTQSVAGAYPAFLYGAGAIDEPTRYLFQFFHGSAKALGGWRDPEIDRLLEAQIAEFDEAKRNALLRQLQSALNDEAPAVWLLSFTNTIGISNRWEWPRQHGSTIYFDTIRAR
ncbi:MAG TPA: ABC transporter substrate-binding protein [Chloroflexota bacterium]